MNSVYTFFQRNKTFFKKTFIFSVAFLKIGAYTSPTNSQKAGDVAFFVMGKDVKEKEQY